MNRLTLCQFLSVFCFLSLSLSRGLAIPKEDGSKRVIDKHLSDKEHLKGTEHNVDYDHEAFLGEDARTFDRLKPEESRKRLGEIFDKIDKDHDGKVCHKELRAWIQKSQKTYIVEDVERQWKAHNPDQKAVMSWEEYKKATYGFIEDGKDEDGKDEDSNTYREMVRRDKRRWTLADQDKDGSLSKEEFGDFLHPEESDHMRQVIVEETLEDIDKDKDGKVSMTEYITDMYSQDGDEVPEWVSREREQFKTHRDTNGDGFMDKDEIRDWIAPPDFDHSDAEARHLITESDGDKDGTLSKQEVLDNYDLFVGSQATDFGEALHDEF